MRYPFAPVEVHRGDTEISVIAERVGVTHATVQKWRQRGMDEKNADRVATALGLHPWQLWPEMLAVATAPVMREWREAKLRRRREGYAANPHPERYKQKLRDAAKREAA
jgi:lambda repressor-like predicted transcriptional regulator